MRIKEIVRKLVSCSYNVSGEDQVHSILNEVDRNHEIIHASISGRTDALTVREVQSMLMSHENRLEQHDSSKELLLPTTNLT